jgi:hypothetical protein
MSWHRDATGKILWTNLLKGCRTGLLDLSDPKYVSSENTICTYYEYALMPGELTNSPKKLVVRIGEKGTLALFPFNKVSSYQLLAPLPAGATIERNYMLFSPITEPADSSGVLIYSLPFRIIALNGVTIDTYIDLVTLSSTFNSAALPVSDPLIKITLMDTCYATLPYTGTGCSGKGCPGYTSTCTPADPKACWCEYA